ncbi:MAG: DUF302 domain-containing protein [Deltaproteobacteria bacterium]|nr:MAG: DUF302 domain-containing protein [Deltaproteobacteria bacterium]
MCTFNAANIFSATTDKSIGEFIADFERAAKPKGFMVHNADKMNMAETFAAHGASVPEGFDLHLVQVCNPQRASKAMGMNPERAALIPKFITVFTKEGTTQVRMLRYGIDFAYELIGDEDFSRKLSGSFEDLTALIEEAL